jgi:hypothetical protein
MWLLVVNWQLRRSKILEWWQEQGNRACGFRGEFLLVQSLLRYGRPISKDVADKLVDKSVWCKGVVWVELDSSDNPVVVDLERKLVRRREECTPRARR